MADANNTSALIKNEFKDPEPVMHQSQQVIHPKDTGSKMNAQTANMAAQDKSGDSWEGQY